MEEKVILPPPPDEKEGAVKKRLKKLKRRLFGDELDAVSKLSRHDRDSARRIEDLLRKR